MTNYSTNVRPCTHKIFVHPWYIQQQKLANTTISESQSRLRQSKEEIGQKFIDEGEIQWAAGLYEGEGTLYRKGGGWCLRIIMTDVDVVKHFGSIYGLKVTGPYTPPENRKDIFHVSTSRRDLIFKIVADFYPYLGERRRQKCDEFLNWYTEKQRETSN